MTTGAYTSLQENVEENYALIGIRDVPVENVKRDVIFAAFPSIRRFDPRDAVLSSALAVYQRFLFQQHDDAFVLPLFTPESGFHYGDGTRMHDKDNRLKHFGIKEKPLEWKVYSLSPGCKENIYPVHLGVIDPSAEQGFASQLDSFGRIAASTHKKTFDKLMG